MHSRSGWIHHTFIHDMLPSQRKNICASTRPPASFHNKQHNKLSQSQARLNLSAKPKILLFIILIIRKSNEHSARPHDMIITSLTLILNTCFCLFPWDLVRAAVMQTFFHTGSTRDRACSRKTKLAIETKHTQTDRKLLC